jgi:copper oxidase (laccase) domain-containing protein
MTATKTETFPALTAQPDIRHAFIRRIPGIAVAADKTEALSRLDCVHREIRREFQLDTGAFATAQQVHGNRVAVIDGPLQSDRCFAESDAIVTNQTNVCLGIYVADCCAVYFLDPVRRAIGLAHSGRKGTELGIVPETIAQLSARFRSSPSDLIMQLSPCIRPPHYEVDFAAEIAKQCRAAGVENVNDCGICTACDLDRYYSYRAEKARTGRMVALFALKQLHSIAGARL